MTFRIGRRDFITLLGGAASWPLAARAQQRERMRRVGVLMNRVADDPEAQARLKAFVQGLQQLGWTEGRNARMDVRWTAGVAANLHRYAAELVALMPDVILADGAVSVKTPNAPYTTRILVRRPTSGFSGTVVVELLFPARRFDWSRCASDTLAVYRSLARRAQPAR